MKMNKVCVNIDQTNVDNGGFSDDEKLQARQNIGAADEQTVNNHTTEIGQIKDDVAGIESALSNKKDKQSANTFNGSSTKTVKTITQDVNGELNVEFENIDYPDYNISSSDESINVSTSEGVTDLTLPNDVVRDSNYVHIDGATVDPLMDGNTSVGVSTKYAREDHIHPTDTSREAIANKTTVILGTSNDKYPTDEAVAKFVNSSIATNTANYISNNGNPFTSVEQLNAYIGTVTNNDYAFVNGFDSDGNTYYDRYKATVNGSSVTWSLEYRLNNSSFTAAQWSAINSGITSALVDKIHDHINKTVLDSITSDNVSNWNNKMDNQTVGNISEPVYLEYGIAKIATDVATKTDLTDLTEYVEGVKSDLTDLTGKVYVHDSDIYQLQADVEDIELALTIKKDMQEILNFSGSNKQTVTNINQNENGELTVEFADIDLSKRVAVDIDQKFNENEQSQARRNIGAASTEITNSLDGDVRKLTLQVEGLVLSKKWNEVDIDTSNNNSSVKNEVAYFGDDGEIGYYFDNGGSLRLTWYNDSSATFKMWANDGSTEINGAGPVVLGASFYNGNGQHNTLRWKLNSFRCIDIHFNPDTKKLYWKEL